MSICGSMLKVSPVHLTGILSKTASHQVNQMVPQHIVSILTKFATYQKAEPGSYLWKEGDTSNALVLVLDGKLESLKETEFPNHPFLTGIHKTGTIVGEDGFIDNLPRNTSVRTINSCSLLIMSRDNFEQLEQNHPAIATLILKRLLDLVSNRLHHSQKRLAVMF